MQSWGMQSYCTWFFCPILWARAWACKSFWGFQSESNMTTVSAVAKLIPSPPALVDNKKQKSGEFSALKWSSACFLNSPAGQVLFVSCGKYIVKDNNNQTASDVNKELKLTVTINTIKLAKAGYEHIMKLVWWFTHLTFSASYAFTYNLKMSFTLTF